MQASTHRLFAVRNSKSAHRERAEGFDLYRHGKELEARVGQLPQPAQMLHDGNLRAKERCMHGTTAIISIVDIIRVNTYQRRACILEIVRCICRQEDVILEVLIGAPVGIPTRVNKYRLTAHIETLERSIVD